MLVKLPVWGVVEPPPADVLAGMLVKGPVVEPVDVPVESPEEVVPNPDGVDVVPSLVTKFVR